MNTEFYERAATLVGACSYKPDWHIHLKYSKKSERAYIQLRVLGADSRTGIGCEWVSGKRWLSEFMTNQEIVGAVFGLIKDAEMHELHEWFRYRGASIYNPHLDPDALVEVASVKDNFVMRPDSMDRA